MVFVKLLVMFMIWIGAAVIFACAALETATAVGAFDAALIFDPTLYETLTVTVNGKPLSVAKHTVTYVANPITIASSQRGPVEDPIAWQKMSIYVPSTAAEDQNTAIILNVNNGGWMNSPLGNLFADRDGRPITAFVSDSNTDKIGAALAAGYVLCDVGTRSRGLVAVDGTYAGHAPAVVVDAKAAIRYLKLNDAVIPGSSDRIVITGSSGGGGLSAVVAASGNSPDYYPYLQEIGAAGIDAFGNSTLTDDVFATISYCPITDLSHADMAYEWQYSATRLLGPYTDGQNPPSKQTMAVSAELASHYPAYLKSLGLKLEDGRPLTAENMPSAIMALVKADLEKAMVKGGETIPDLGESWTFIQRDGKEQVVTNDWLDVDNEADTVVSINYVKYLEFVCKTAQLKTAPAFDNYGTSLQYRMNESNLSGNKVTEYSHWIEWSWEHDVTTGNGVGADDTGFTFDEFMKTAAGKAVAMQMKMINPIPYLLSDEGDSAPYWYVRYGMRDRDTSFAVELALFYAIRSDPTVHDANFGIVYMQPHGGNYDVLEAYAWLADALK